MKFIVLIVSAAICFNQVESAARARLLSEDVCCIKEELRGLGTVYDASGAAMMVSAQRSGNIDSLVALPGCGNVPFGMAPTQPVAKAAALAAGQAYHMVSATDPASPFFGVNFVTGSNIYSPDQGMCSAGEARLAALTAANTYNGLDAINYFFSANLGTQNLYGGTDNGIPFKRVAIPKLVADDFIHAIAAKAQAKSDAPSNVIMAKKTSLLGAKVRVLSATAEVFSGGEFREVRLKIENEVDFSPLDKVDALGMTSNNLAAFALGNGMVLGANIQKGLSAMRLITHGEVLHMHVMEDLRDSSGNSIAYSISTLEKRQYDSKIYLGLYVIDPRITNTLNVLAKHHIELSRSTTERELTLTSLPDLAASKAAGFAATFGHIAVISASDPLTCRLENERNARLYCRCMKKCCEAAEHGKTHCPRRCELEEDRCDECSGGFIDREFLNTGYEEFDGLVAREEFGGLEEFSEDIDGYRYHHGCGCDHHDGCRKCGCDRDLRECKCCCRKYLKRVQCCRTVMQTIKYEIAL